MTYPETVSGKIADENGVEIISVETYYGGMCVFDYWPDQGKKYYLKCKNGNGLEKQFELPQPNPRAYSLSVSIRNERILIGVQKSFHAPDIPRYLLVHCRGDILHFEEWDDEQEFAFMEKELPAGVIQIVLFDEQMNPLSDRLVFSKNNADTKVEFHTDKDIYQRREKVTTTLSFPDSLFYSNFISGHFSIAVTDDKDIAPDESTTILSSLLLSSELKGYIENPAYYLQDDDAMVLLMKTHGWRRYNVPEVVKGHFEKPQISFQMYQEISDQVRTLNSQRTVPDSEIYMMKGGSFGVTTTDRNGSFTVPQLDSPDSTTFYMRALVMDATISGLFLKKSRFPCWYMRRKVLYQKFRLHQEKQ